MKKSEFVLKHADGTYHTLKHEYSGCDTIISVAEIDRAKRFEAYEYAVHHKNNQSHLRHKPMTVVELRYEIEVVDRGEVPVTVPDWDDFNESYDKYLFGQAKESQ